MSFLFFPDLQHLVYSVADFGAVSNGVHDDTTLIQNAVNAAFSAGGGMVYMPGLSAISASITLKAGVMLCGSGPLSGLTMLAGFSDSQAVLCSGNNSGVCNLQIRGASTTYSRNPAADAIQITGCTGTLLEHLLIQYVNGWAVQSTGTSGQANFNTRMHDVRSNLGAKGFHLLGVTGSSYGGVQRLENCYASLCQNGDSLFIEDCYDIEVVNLFGECSAGSGNALHIKGACNAIHVSNVDIGYFPGPTAGATVLIEASANGSPNFVTLRGGIVEGGTAGISITGGNLITLGDLHLYNNGTYGMNLTGGDAIVVHDCAFSYNGSAGSSGRYDFQSTVNAHVIVDTCYFYTGQGTTTETTNNAVNVTTGAVTMQNCAFYGSGYNASNIFNNKPSTIRNCPGYNPVGGLSAPSIPTTGNALTNPFNIDASVFITGGTVSAIAIGNTATGLTSGLFRIPAGQTITLTYSGAPTWVWIGD